MAPRLRLRLRAATSTTPKSQTAIPCPWGSPGAVAHPPELPELTVGGATHWSFELHTLGATQSSTEVHVVAHLPVLSTQIYGAQLVAPASTCVSIFEV
jgi:hypothetical protein